MLALISRNWMARRLLFVGLLLVTACQSRTPGNAYIDKVLQEAAAATRVHLRQVAQVASTHARRGSGREAAAATTFSDPVLLELRPCSAHMRFNYSYQGIKQVGSADLEYDRTRRAWLVTKLWMIHEE